MSIDSNSSVEDIAADVLGLESAKATLTSTKASLLAIVSEKIDKLTTTSKDIADLAYLRKMHERLSSE